MGFLSTQNVCISLKLMVSLFAEKKIIFCPAAWAKFSKNAIFFYNFLGICSLFVLKFSRKLGTWICEKVTISIIFGNIGILSKGLELGNANFHSKKQIQFLFYYTILSCDLFRYYFHPQETNYIYFF